MWSRIAGSTYGLVGRRPPPPRRPSARAPAATATTSCEPLAQVEPLRPDLDRLRVETRQVEQLLDERRHARRLLLERDAQLAPCCVVVEPVAEMVQRLDEAVHRRHRRAQLVRGERDEVRHHLVRALERDAATGAPARTGARGRARSPVSAAIGLQRAAARPRRRTARTATSTRAASRRAASIARPRRRAVPCRLARQVARDAERRVERPVAVEDRRRAARRRARRRGRARALRPRRGSSRASSGRGSPPAAAAAPACRQ